jgi:hypothetical protein
MTVITSKEFLTNEEKYFQLALNERVFIKKGNNMFIVVSINVEELEEDDDDEYISKEEFVEESYKILDKFFAKK